MICFVSALIFSCNARRKDRVVDDAMQQMERGIDGNASKCFYFIRISLMIIVRIAIYKS